MASGGNDINHIDTSPPQEAYVLYGAVVGGPDLRDKFYDIRSDWPQTEVSLGVAAPVLPRITTAVFFFLSPVLLFAPRALTFCHLINAHAHAGRPRLQRTDAHARRDACP
jgi:hypothetical protein